MEDIYLGYWFVLNVTYGSLDYTEIMTDYIDLNWYNFPHFTVIVLYPINL